MGQFQWTLFPYMSQCTHKTLLASAWQFCVLHKAEICWLFYVTWCSLLSNYFGLGYIRFKRTYRVFYSPYEARHSDQQSGGVLHVLTLLEIENKLLKKSPRRIFTSAIFCAVSPSLWWRNISVVDRIVKIITNFKELYSWNDISYWKKPETDLKLQLLVHNNPMLRLMLHSIYGEK